MASIELNMDNVEGIENWTPLEAQCLLSPPKNTPQLDFSQLTPSQLGISIQSFTPSSNSKDKSRMAQLKMKRRSNVGARGSPETNSLIRYIAQQRMKIPPPTSTSTQARVSSTLKQKMATFQSLMDLEENEMPETGPRRPDSQMGGCFKAGDNLSEGRSCGDGKENTGPPIMTSPPKKRSRTGLLRKCVEEIREANSPVLRRTALKKQEATTLAAALPQEEDQSTQAQEAADVEPALLSLSPPLSPLAQTSAWEPRATALNHHTPSEEQQDSLDQSLPVVEDTGPGRAAQPPPFTRPSLPKMNPIEEADPSGRSAMKRKKTVRFGVALSPEFFDKTLPPSSPLLKGATPARIPTSAGGGSQLRSLLKTPQRGEPTPRQHDFGSPALTGTSPVINMGPRCSMALRRGGEGTETHHKIVFPSIEEDVEGLLADDAEVDCETGPLDLNAAFFQEDSINETLSEGVGTLLLDAIPEPACTPEPAPVLDPEPAPVLDPEPAPVLDPEPAPVLDPEPGPEEPQPEAEPGNAAASPPPPPRSHSRKRRRKAEEACEEEEGVMKRSTRSAGKCASGKMKKTATRKRGWGSKEVNHSLYGKRVYASKNPLLSPITETQSCASRSPTPQPPRTRKHTEEDPGPSLPLEVVDGDLITSRVTAALCRPATEASSDARRSRPNSAAVDASNGLSEVREAPPVDPPTPTSDSPGKAAAAASRPGRRSGRPKASRAEPRRGASRGRKVSVPVDHWLSPEPEEEEQGETAEERIQDPTTTKSEVLASSLPEDAVADGGEVEPNKPPRTAAAVARRHASYTPSDRHTGGREEVQAGAEEDDPRDSPCPAADVGSAKRVRRESTRPKGRRSSMYVSSVLEEEEAPRSELLSGEGAEEGGEQGGERCEPTASQPDPEHGSETQEGPEEQGVSWPSYPDLVLPPWQVEFNIEDVLRPPPTRGYLVRSVRRSLRNLSTSAPSDAGLAWVPHTSPDSLRAVRRKTRGRRSSILALHPPPPAPEDLDL